MKKIIINIVISILIIISFSFSYFYTLKQDYTWFIEFILTKFREEKKDYKIDFVKLYIKRLENNNYFKVDKIIDNNKYEEVVLNTKEPLIYIYSTHTNEEYSYSKNDIYNVIPTVKTASYILEEELNKLGINSIVEEKNTTDLINQDKLPYSDSYKISRILLENKKNEYNSLEYFLDIHRDSVKRSVTTIEIDGVSYARIMFVLGLENKNYEENKKVMTKINDYLNINYPGLSRGIYEKQGKGVNGVYNQDFNKNTMLIEIGGVDNSIDEVANSVKIIAEALYDYLNKSTN